MEETWTALFKMCILVYVIIYVFVNVCTLIFSQIADINQALFVYFLCVGHLDCFHFYGADVDFLSNFAIVRANVTFDIHSDNLMVLISFMIRLNLHF